MGRKKNSDSVEEAATKLRTAPCVPALRAAVLAWRAGGYKGTTTTTRGLLRHWFKTAHQGADGVPFEYHLAQQEAIETLIFVWEFEKVHSRDDLRHRYSEESDVSSEYPEDKFARYCIKMATGTGKTKVMALAIVWQFLNAVQEQEGANNYAKTFLLIAPNVIVLERLKTDFAGGKIFLNDPMIPKEMLHFWNMSCIIRGENDTRHAEGAIFLTNIQQLYPKIEGSEKKEPQPITAVMGRKSPPQKLKTAEIRQQIGLREGPLMVLNDEAHHTHDEDSEWNNVIAKIHQDNTICIQLDVSATPRTSRGTLFPWVIFDYPLKQAILDGVVKRPVRGVAQIDEEPSALASVRYQGFLVAAVERWSEYKRELVQLGKKPILFIMLHEAKAADDVGAWLRERYPEEFGAEKTLIIHTRQNGEISDSDLDSARQLARDVDSDRSNVSAIVSVLMLREGWDVQNVTVVVGLRPMTSKASILPEQAVGRGLRLMFRGRDRSDYSERVDIIGSAGFLRFVDDLEKLEGLEFEKFPIGKEKLKIVAIYPLPERALYDISIPQISASLIRKKSIAAEIAEIDVSSLVFPTIPLRSDGRVDEKFAYDGWDILTNVKEFHREYDVPTPQTAQEVIGYYSRRIAERVKLPSHFAAIALKIKEFFVTRAFGSQIDLAQQDVIKAMTTPVASMVTLRVFELALNKIAVEKRIPTRAAPDRRLSACPGFPWSRQTFDSRKSVFNLVPVDNDLEEAFARFLERAVDVKAFAKLPQQFGFAIEYLDRESSLRLYYPDFVVVDNSGNHHLIETKGAQTDDVQYKDAAARLWCENATELTGEPWRFVKVKQKTFKQTQATTLADVVSVSALDA